MYAKPRQPVFSQPPTLLISPYRQDASIHTSLTPDQPWEKNTHRPASADSHPSFAQRISNNSCDKHVNINVTARKDLPADRSAAHTPRIIHVDATSDTNNNGSLAGIPRSSSSVAALVAQASMLAPGELHISVATGARPASGHLDHANMLNMSEAVPWAHASSHDSPTLSQASESSEDTVTLTTNPHVLYNCLRERHLAT